jgi:hypothetical protein
MKETRGGAMEGQAVYQFGRYVGRVIEEVACAAEGIKKLVVATATGQCVYEAGEVEFA